MTTLVTHNPITVPTPPGAAWAAAAWMAVSGAVARFQAAFSQRDERAGTMGRASEANRLRKVAQGFMSSDPRFAADLFAAADRHERAD